MNIKYNRKNIIIILSIIIIFSALSITIAYIQSKSSNINEFSIGVVTPQIIETFDNENKIKSDVSVKNIGNVDIYIRVAIIYSFETSDGDILLEEPVLNTDYEIIKTSNNWLLGNDGYYYYKYKVKPNELTENIFDECKQIKEYEDKYFSVDVVAQAIQAEPIKAVEEIWDVNIENNIIKIGEL